MLILVILLIVMSIFGVIFAIDEYNKPLPNWYGVTSPFWTGFWKTLHTIARFILTIFWIFWWAIVIGMIFSGHKKAN